MVTGSSQDCVPTVTPKQKSVKISVTKTAGSERLLGEISAKEKLLSENSQDSILSEGHKSSIAIRDHTTPPTGSRKPSPHDVNADQEPTSADLVSAGETTRKNDT